MATELATAIEDAEQTREAPRVVDETGVRAHVKTSPDQSGWELRRWTYEQFGRTAKLLVETGTVDPVMIDRLRDVSAQGHADAREVLSKAIESFQESSRVYLDYARELAVLRDVRERREAASERLPTLDGEVRDAVRAGKNIFETQGKLTACREEVRHLEQFEVDQTEVVARVARHAERELAQHLLAQARTTAAALKERESRSKAALLKCIDKVAIDLQRQDAMLRALTHNRVIDAAKLPVE